MRLQRYLAMCGISSRRKCEELIRAGRVVLNGEVAQIGASADLGDDVRLDGERVLPEGNMRYILYYKPIGEVATVSDPQGRRTVLDRFKGIIKERIFPIGRLDYDTEGLLLLTNDGELMQKLAHPSNEVAKTYIARVRGIPDEAELERLRSGILLPDGVISSKATAKIYPRGSISDVELIIHEGRNRQVRHMLEAIGYPVITLKRVALHGLSLSGLHPGEWRELTAGEVEGLKFSGRG